MLTLRASATIRALAEHPPSRLLREAEIADTTRQPRKTVAYHLQRLHEAGLVEVHVVPAPTRPKRPARGYRLARPPEAAPALAEA